MDSILVSIIIPTYNNADKIIETLDSVINQTYDSIEIVVVDDGSTDDTERILFAYKQHLQNTKKFIYHKQQNAGAPSARNRGMEICNGSLVKFLDSDDCLFNEQVIKNQVNFLIEGGYDIVSGKEILYNSTFTSQNFVKDRGGSIMTNSPETFFAHHPITSSFLVRYDKLRHFKWETTLKSGQEFFLLFQFYLNNFQFGYQDEPVINVRMHDSPHRISNQSKNKKAANDLILLKRMVMELNKLKVEKTKFKYPIVEKFTALAFSAYRAGNAADANSIFTVLRESFTPDISNTKQYLILNLTKLSPLLGYSVFKMFTLINK
jgi:glycosyltransferase involved in cell wall biosynthesis